MKTKNFLQSTGRINNTHYASYYPELGLTIIKQYPRKRRSDQWTEGQKEQRNRFGIINAFAKRNRFSIIQTIWNMQKGDGLNGYNRFIKRNSQAFNHQGLIKDVNKLFLSSGVLPIIPSPKYYLEEKNDLLHITWETYSARPFERNSDKLAYIIYRENTSLKPIYTASKRMDEECIIDIKNENLKMGDVIFLFFSDFRRIKFSDSVPLTITSDNLQM